MRNLCHKGTSEPYATPTGILIRIIRFDIIKKAESVMIRLFLTKEKIGFSFLFNRSLYIYYQCI